MAFLENRRYLAETHESELYEFILNNCQEDLYEILRHPNQKGHFSIPLHFLEFKEECPKSCAALLRTPDKVLPVADKAVDRAQKDLYEASDSQEVMSTKKHIHLRIHSMPAIWDRYKTEFPGSSEFGYFITLAGTIVRTTASKVLEFKKIYRCNKCKQTTNYEALPSQRYAFPNVLEKCENGCANAKLEQLSEQKGDHNVPCFKDYQEVKLQEQMSSTGFGVMPKAFWVALEDDLVDSCKPGDDVAITGSLFPRLIKPMRPGQPMRTEMVFKANHVQVMNDERAAVLINKDTIEFFDNFWILHKDNPFVGRNIILKSFCSEVYGMYLVKLALCVVLAGGVAKEDSGSHVRGESHLLMIGDPGTGKSQLLKYISKIIPRAVFTNGIGTTTAGLTVSAVKDGGEWALEAGALVLADSGVCCIDEFSTIKEHDRVSIHEAMEQQSISVAKAGMVCKISTKCTVIAATNPKFGRYDEAEPIEINIGLASPLLSRFDLIIVLKDAHSEAWDEFLCDFVLSDMDDFKVAAKKAEQAGFIWNSEKLQSYMVLIKEKIPVISSEAQQVLTKYFLHQRRSEARSEARTTVRLLESLFRLAEGHARLMYRNNVILHDAISAVSLLEASMQSFALSPVPNTLHIAYPEDPFLEYYNQAKAILNQLGLSNLWMAEKAYLDNLMSLRS